LKAFSSLSDIQYKIEKNDGINKKEKANKNKLISKNRILSKQEFFLSTEKQSSQVVGKN